MTAAFNKTIQIKLNKWNFSYSQEINCLLKVHIKTVIILLAVKKAIRVKTMEENPFKFIPFFISIHIIFAWCH